MSSDPRQPNFFPTTHWTLIGRLKHGGEKEAKQALDEICQTYHYPLYCFARRFGLGPHDAEDALQDFVLRLLKRETLKQAEAGRGRLRAFLLTSFRNFLINRHHEERTERRGGGALHLPIEELGDESRYTKESGTESPERLYERKWAIEMLRVAMRRLKKQYQGPGKIQLYQAFAPILGVEGSGRGENMAPLAVQLGMSESALRTALSRFRKEYREILMQEVIKTVEDQSEAKEEVQYLLGLFS